MLRIPAESLPKVPLGKPKHPISHRRPAIRVSHCCFCPPNRPEVEYTSARVRNSWDGVSQRLRVAPNIAVEILSPGERAGACNTKFEAYFQFGATVVLVLHPLKRRVWLHRADLTVEERDARGMWPLERFDGMVPD